MDWLLTEEQRMLKEMVEHFARDKIRPVAKENDKTKEFPTEVIVSAHTSLCIDPIYQFGTEQQKRKYMPDLCSGRKLGCLCLSEPEAGSDVGAITTSARLEGDTWVLNGTKQFVSNAAQADVAIVFAMTDPGARTRGMTAFIVEKATPGCQVGKLEEKLGIHACWTAQIILEDCAIPKESQLGELNQGFKVAMVTLDGGRIGIAAQALGIAKGAIEDAVEYAKQRQQFGQAIAEFQGIKWYLADMQTEYEAAWLLTYRAALMKDRKLRHSKEAPWRSSKRRRSPNCARPGPSRSMAGMAIPRSSMWSDISGTPRSPRSTRAPAKSSAKLSPGTY